MLRLIFGIPFTVVMPLSFGFPPKILGASKFAIAYQVYLNNSLAATAQTIHLCIDPAVRKTLPLTADLQTWLTSQSDTGSAD